jgi:cbb3-type cytochrome oxidase subunit 3
MELETAVFVARVATRVLLVMSAICVIGTAIWIFRICRESRNERAAQSPVAPGA